MRQYLLLIMLIGIGIIPTLYAKDIYPFADKAQSTRFQTLTANLRCLVCQNESLSDSNAPLAGDLRLQ